MNKRADGSRLWWWFVRKWGHIKEIGVEIFEERGPEVRIDDPFQGSKLVWCFLQVSVA